MSKWSQTIDEGTLFVSIFGRKQVSRNLLPIKLFIIFGGYNFVLKDSSDECFILYIRHHVIWYTSSLCEEFCPKRTKYALKNPKNISSK